MKPVTRLVALTVLLAASLMIGACTSQKRMESANGRVEDLHGPVSPDRHPGARKAVTALTADQEKALQNEVLALPEGLLTFDTPPALRRNSPVRVEARLSNDFISKLNEALAANKAVAGVKVNDILGMQLNATGITIKPLSSQEQKLATEGHTTWAWELDPATLGRQSLTLNLILHLSNESGQKQRAYPVVERFVEVQEAEGGFFSTYGWWILALVLVGAAVVLLVKKP
jgi:hypothetical protein